MKARILTLAIAALVVTPIVIGTQSQAMNLKLGSVKIGKGISVKSLKSDLSLKKIEHGIHNAFDTGRHL